MVISVKMPLEDLTGTSIDGKVTMSVFLPGIYLVALLHGAFLISLLFRHARIQPANLYLAAFIFILMISLWNISMPYMEVPTALKFKIIDQNLYATPFFWGPLVYLYTLHITKPQSAHKNGIFAHLFAPSLVTFVELLFSGQIQHLYLPVVLLLCFYIQAVVYIIFSYRLVLAHQKRVVETFSQIDRIHLSWLKRLIAVFAALMIIDFSLAVAMNIRLIAFGPAMGLIVLLESATIFAIGYFSIQQRQILFPEPGDQANIKTKYDNSALDTPLSKQLATQLITIMENDQPYKRNDLKLNDLAELIGLSSHHLSQVINEQLGCNFYEFINQYRIEYAAQLMRTGLQDNVTRLAFDAGFNNRVSFTNAFKKKMGVTPSAFLKDQKLQQAS